MTPYLYYCHLHGELTKDDVISIGLYQPIYCRYCHKEDRNVIVKLLNKFKDEDDCSNHIN